MDLGDQFAGAVACTMTTPLDVAKTRVMTQNPLNPMMYMGLQATLQKIWLEEVSRFGQELMILLITLSTP